MKQSFLPLAALFVAIGSVFTLPARADWTSELTVTYYSVELDNPALQVAVFYPNSNGNPSPPEFAEFYARAESSATQHDNDTAGVYMVVSKVYTPTIGGAQFLSTTHSGTVSAQMQTGTPKGDLGASASFESNFNATGGLKFSVSALTSMPANNKTYSSGYGGTFSSPVTSTATLNVRASGNHSEAYAEGSL